MNHFSHFTTFGPFSHVNLFTAECCYHVEQNWTKNIGQNTEMDR